MKTAMQELIYDLKLLHEKDDVKVVDIETLISYAEGKLEKEKEQIVDAYRNAAISNTPNEIFKNYSPDYWQVNAELWYDKYYNQN